MPRSFSRQLLFATLRVVRENGVDGTLRATYTTVAGVGTALPGDDYVPTSGTVVFKRGETEKTVSVQLLPRNVYRSDVTFAGTACRSDCSASRWA